MARYRRSFGKSLGNIIGNAVSEAVKQLPTGTAPRSGGDGGADRYYEDAERTPVTQEEKKRDQPKEKSKEEQKEDASFNKDKKDIFQALFSGEDSGGDGMGGGGGGFARGSASYDDYFITDPKTGERSLARNLSDERKSLSNRDYGVLSAMSTGMTQQEAEKLYDDEVNKRMAEAQDISNMAASVSPFGQTLTPDKDQIADSLLRDTRASIFEGIPGLDDWRVGMVDNPLTATARAQRGSEARASGQDQGPEGALQEGGRAWEDEVLDAQARAQQAIAGGQPDFADSLSRGDAGSLLGRDVLGTLVGLPFGIASIPGTAGAALGDTSKGYTLDSEYDAAGERTGEFSVRDRTGSEQQQANLASALDVGGFAFGGGTVANAARGAGRGVRQVARDAAENALVEGATEGIQGSLEAGANREDYTQEDILNSVLGGAIGGGAFGGAGSAAGQIAASRRANRASQTNTGVDIVAPVDEVDAAGVLPMEQQPAMATSIDQGGLDMAAARMPDPGIPPEMNNMAAPMPDQAPLSPGQMPLEAPQTASQGMVDPATINESQIQQDIAPMSAPMADTAIPGAPMNAPMTQTTEQAMPGSDMAAMASPEQSMIAETRSAPMAAFERNPSLSNTNQAASAILADFIAARDMGDASSTASMVGELQSVLQPLAQRQANRSEYVKNGMLDADEATSELLDVWTSRLSQNPEEVGNWESVTKGLLSNNDTSVSNVLRNLNEELGGIEPVAAQPQATNQEQATPATQQAEAAAQPSDQATRPEPSEPAPVDRARKAPEPSRDVVEPETNTENQSRTQEEPPTAEQPPESSEGTKSETRSSEQPKRKTKREKPSKKETAKKESRSASRDRSGALTREQREADSVVRAMDDIANNELFRDGGERLSMRSELTLSEVESRVSDSIGTELTDAQRALVSGLYVQGEVNAQEVMNASPDTYIDGGALKTTNPDVAYFLTSFDSASESVFSPDQLISVVRAGSEIRYIDETNLEFDGGPVFTREYSLAPRVEAMLQNIDNNIPLYIAKPGVLGRKTSGATFSVPGTSDVAIVLNGDVVLEQGQYYNEVGAVDTTAHEQAHAFVRTLNVYDSPRAEALRNRLEELVPNDSYFDQWRDQVVKSYPELEVNSTEFNEEVMAFAVGDYVEKLGRRETPSIPARVRAWLEDFVSFIKDTFHLQRYSARQILEMTPEQLVASVSRSTVEGVFSAPATPDAALSLSDYQLANIDTETLIDAVSDGDADAAAAIRESLDLSEYFTATPPANPFTGEPVSNISRDAGLFSESELVYDDNGRPIPPGRIPETNEAFEALLEDSPIWQKWYEETNQFNRDSIIDLNIDEEALRYQEQDLTSEFLGQAGAYAPNSKRLRAVYLFWKQRLYDPYAPATAVENAVLKQAREKAKSEIKGTKRKNLTREERMQIRRETEQWAARYRVAHAKVIAQRATDRISGFARRTGLLSFKRWLENNDQRQADAKDYMDAREILGARDYLYDDVKQFSEEATARGFSSTSQLFSWAEDAVENSPLPQSRKDQIDKVVREVGNYVVDNALEAGEITEEHARNVKALNELGSYWIMKLNDDTINEAQSALLQGNVNALLNNDENGLVKGKAEQFRTGTVHPVTALYGGLQIATYRTDTARRNKAAVDVLLQAGLAQEFNIAAYESGSSALPERSKTGLSVKQYERLKEVYDAMYQEGRSFERTLDEKGNDQYFSYLEVIEEGERKAYAVPRDLYDAFADLAFKESDNQAMNVLNRFMRGFATIVRTFTTTANVSLQAILFVRDVLAVAMTGPSANLRGMNTLKFLGKGVYSAFAENQELSEKGIAGDAFSRVATRTQESEVRRAFSLSEMNPGKAKAAGNTFITYLEHGLNFSETVARAMLYHQARQAYLDVGHSEAVADQMAITKAAQGIGNFRESGSWVARIGPFTAYANAALQGSRGAFRMATDQPVQNAVRMVSTFALLGTTSTIMLAALGYDQDDWDEAVRALPDSQKYRGIPMPKPGEPPKVNYETNKIEGIWMFPMPEFVYPLLNILNDPDHASKTAKQAAFDNLSLIALSITGIDIHGDDWDEMAMSLANQWLPNAVKPFIETRLSTNLYTGIDFFRDGDLDKVDAGLSTRNQLTVTGYSDTEHAIADFFTSFGVDMSAADVDTWARSMGSMASNVADEKPLWNFGSTWEPWIGKRAVSPYLQDDVYSHLAVKWNQGETRLSETEKNNAREDFDRSFGTATNLLNELRSETKTPEELRALVDPEGGGVSAPTDSTLVLTAIGIRAESEGWTKEQAAEEAAKFWTTNQSEIFNSDKYTRQDVADYYDYLALAGEAFNSPRLKAQAEFAKSDRFWTPGATPDDQYKQMQNLKEDYRAVNDVYLALNRTLSEQENPDVAVETRKLTEDLSDRLRIVFSRYEETFDPDLWYTRDDMKDFLKADLSDVSDEQWNEHALKYYEALYNADGDCYAEGRDDLTSTSSSGYLYASAKINSEYGVSKYIQECYGDGRSEMNISLTAWRELEETDPELYDLLYAYDSLRTDAGVSRKQGKHGERKYYQKSSGSGRRSGGYSRRGGGGGGGGAARFHVPTVADLSMETWAPKGNKITTSTSVKKQTAAPVSYTSVPKTASSGQGIKTKPANFQGAKTVKYEKSKTRQPAMGEPYMSYLEGRSTQDSFKAARRYM